MGVFNGGNEKEKGTGNSADKKHNKFENLVKDPNGYIHISKMSEGNKEDYDRNVSRVMLILCVVMFCLGLVNMASGMRKKAKVTEKIKDSEEMANVSVELLKPRTFIQDANLNAEIKSDGGKVYEPSPVTGTLVRNLVHKGDKVKVGDILGYIDATDIGVSYNEAPIYAHADGIVVDVIGVPGQKIGMSSNLYTIEYVGNLRLEGTLSERDLGTLKTGAIATFKTVANPDIIQEAQLRYISPSVNSINRTVDVEFDVTSKDELKKYLKPGMFVSVVLQKSKLNNVKVVPTSAIKSTGTGKHYLYVVEDGLSKQKYVEIGQQNQTESVITSGINYGEAVVIKGTTYDGTKVNIIEE